jgi:FeS assembly SUF system protein
MDTNPNPAHTLTAQELEERIIAVLRSCYDPEIPVNIYDLGLIYDLEVDPFANVEVRMTLTAPGCPVAGTLPVEVEEKIKTVEGVSSVRVKLVWEPPWTPDKMTEAAKLQLGLW